MFYHQHSMSTTNYHFTPSSVTSHHYLFPSATMLNSHPPQLQPPIFSASYSQGINMGINPPAAPYAQPVFNLQERFLHRSIENCSTHLTATPRTRWLKARSTAHQHLQLISRYDCYRPSESVVDSPLHLHYRTPKVHLTGMFHKIANVRFFTIHTELDKPTRYCPHGKPALIQIQAIHYESCSSIILIEVQHLPPTSSSLFQSIRQLCHLIFSSHNTIMAWGDAHKELEPFEQFDLFDLSQVTNTFNIQEFFTQNWNVTHPHTQECMSRHQPVVDDCISDDTLICLVNTEDLDHDINPPDPLEDHTDCICPDEIRPYKSTNSSWSLHKAIELTFHKALDTPLICNVWSCGLDYHLNTWHDSVDQRIRENLLLYAMNDLFAPTEIFFHMDPPPSSFQHLTTPIRLTTIHNHLSDDPPLFIVVADSHGKHLSPLTVTPHYKIVVRYLSGLHWIHQSNEHLSTMSFICSSAFSPLLSICSGVVFLVGTNSVRSRTAALAIDELKCVITVLRSCHKHLTRRTNISICSVFPCINTSSFCPSRPVLSSNIQHYNSLLYNLAVDLNVSILEMPISHEHLSSDGMHVHPNNTSIVFNSIQHHIIQLVHKQSRISTVQRSTTAKVRRNKRNHERLKLKQQQHVVIRQIDRDWKLTELKCYLKRKGIRYSRLPEIRHHRLHIQFNDATRQQQAEQALTIDAFDKQHYNQWMMQERS